MKIKLLFFISLSLLSLYIHAQKCNCAQEFNWVMKTFKENDAGFQYIIDKKGLNNYQDFTEKQIAKAKNVTDIKECENIMSDWLEYFRKFHLFVNTFDENDSWKYSYSYFMPSDYTPIVTANKKAENNSAVSEDLQKPKEPYIKALSKNTLYFYIPSFGISYKVKIDSVLKVNSSLLKKIPNLIIDIRDSGGGNDDSFSGIIPYLYTNPIRSMGIEIKATELNKKGYMSYAKMFEANHNERLSALCNNIAKEIEANMGKFFMPSNIKPVEIDTSYTQMPYPKKIGIICGNGNGSSDEEFLLEAKQSSKVKIFGRSTLGCLDISNMNYAFSPSGIFWMGYGMSKSLRIPDFCIDNVGLQPDYFIDSTITDWVSFTQNILEQE